MERLLHIKVSHIEYPQIERIIAPFYSSKGVRLDVYLRDEDKVIDVELQSYPQAALGKRTRYYQSMIDIDSLMKGQDYLELKESYILFICKYDPFTDGAHHKCGLPVYTFRNTCEEDRTINLNDKTVKVIYNANAYEKASDGKIRGFLRYVATSEPGKDDFSRRLSALVDRIKQDDKFRSDYKAMNLHDRDLIRNTRQAALAEGMTAGMAKGIAKGTQNARIEAARNLLKMNLGTAEQIALAAGLPLETVLKLQKEL